MKRKLWYYGQYWNIITNISTKAQVKRGETDLIFCYDLRNNQYWDTKLQEWINI